MQEQDPSDHIIFTDKTLNGMGKSILASNPHLYKKKGAAPNIPLLGSLFSSTYVVLSLREQMAAEMSSVSGFHVPMISAAQGKLNVNSSPCHDFCSERKKFEAQIEANIRRELEKKISSKRLKDRVSLVNCSVD